MRISTSAGTMEFYLFLTPVLPGSRVGTELAVEELRSMDRALRRLD